MNSIEYKITLRDKKGQIIFSETYEDTSELIFHVELFAKGYTFYVVQLEARVDDKIVKYFTNEPIEKLDYMVTVAELVVEKAVQDED